MSKQQDVRFTRHHLDPHEIHGQDDGLAGDRDAYPEEHYEAPEVNATVRVMYGIDDTDTRDKLVAMQKRVLATNGEVFSDEERAHMRKLLDLLMLPPVDNFAAGETVNLDHCRQRRPVTIERIVDGIAYMTSGSFGDMGPYQMRFCATTGEGLGGYWGSRISKLEESK